MIDWSESKLLRFQLSLGDDLSPMVIQTVDDWSSWLKVHVHGGSLRFLGKVTLRLKDRFKIVATKLAFHVGFVAILNKS